MTFVNSGTLPELVSSSFDGGASSQLMLALCYFSRSLHGACMGAHCSRMSRCWGPGAGKLVAAATGPAGTASLLCSVGPAGARRFSQAKALCPANGACNPIWVSTSNHGFTVPSCQSPVVTHYLQFHLYSPYYKASWKIFVILKKG